MVFIAITTGCIGIFYYYYSWLYSYFVLLLLLVVCVFFLLQLVVLVCLAFFFASRQDNTVIMWDVMGTEIRIDREKNFIDNEVRLVVPTGVPRS